MRDLVKQINDENTHMVEDEVSSSEFSGTIDTGSYILNAAFSGSIFGGIPNNKITAFAGETSTGKTFFALGVIKQFLDKNPDGGVLYYDTEAAVTKAIMEQRGIDSSRVAVVEPTTIQEFRKHALDVLDAVGKDHPPMVMILDSLGQLSTTKEIEDTAEGKETRDMTKAQVIKATFRVLSLKLAKAKIPMLIINHVYDVIGNLIKVRMGKSRFTKENKEIEVKLTYDKGLDRYYGLLDLAESAGIFKKVSTRYELENGTKVFGKAIMNDPEKYFTEDVLQKLEEHAGSVFMYGAEEDEVEDEDNPVEGT